MFFIASVILLMSTASSLPETDFIRKEMIDRSSVQAFSPSRKLLQEQDCDIQVKVKTCPDSISRLKPLELFATITSTCELEKITINWRIVTPEDEIRFTDQNPLVLKPYFFTKATTYALQLDVVGVPYAGEPVFDYYDGCYIKVRAEVPIPIITGANERTVRSGKKVIIDGSKSVDVDVPPGEKPQLLYKWECNLKEGDENLNFCLGNLPKADSVTIPKKYVLDGYKYEFTLSVKTANDKVKWQTTKQTITFKDNAVELVTICGKNCPPVATATISDIVTILRVYCIGGECGNVKPESYKWTVLDENDFDYEKDTQFGRNTDKFVINSEVLKPGKTYKFNVALTDGPVGTSTKFLKIRPGIQIEECSVQPPDGTALRTSFKVSCKFTGKPTKFMVYTSKKEKVVPVAVAPTIQMVRFTLPAKTDAFIKMTDHFNAQAVKQLQVSVSPAIKEPSQEKEVMKVVSQVLHAASDLLQQQRFNYVAQYLNGLLEELNVDNFVMKKIRRQVVEEIMKEILKVPMGTNEELRQVAALASLIGEKNIEPFDPELDKTASSLCRNAASRQLNMTQSEPYVKSTQVEDTAKTLINCVEVRSKHDLDDLLPENNTFRPTTPFPLRTEIDVITEDYPDYFDETIPSHKTNFVAISTNVVEICNSTSRIMAATLAEGEKPIFASSKSCRTVVMRSNAKDLAGKVIETNGVSIKLPESFSSLPYAIDVLICVWPSDIFWWNSDQFEASTATLLLTFLKSNTEHEIATFGSGLKLTFPILNEFSLEVRRIKFPPDDFIPTDDFSVVRLDVPARQSFQVEFLEMLEADQFKVVITNFQRPEPSDFDRSQLITSVNNKIHQENGHDFDAWWYIGVRNVCHLPGCICGHGFVKDHDLFFYSLQVYSISCYMWDSSIKNYEFACPGSVDQERENITCECSHLSLLTGILRNITIHVEDKVIQSDFAMSLIYSLVIFICTATVICLYSILIIVIALNRGKSRKTVYLLADTSRFACFLYLVIVKTGRALYSGTTSNVCIKIYGTKGKTKSHVLNYPDPQRKMLQRDNEDWFLLASERYIGEITSIALWFDSIGRNPSWLCEEITIYDIQTKKGWHFRVDHWFDLMTQKGECYVEVKFTNREEKTRGRILRMFKTCECTHSCLEWKFSFFAMTIVLSAILTIFFTNLVLYKLPRLRLSDGFSKINHYSLYGFVIWISALSALIAFTAHWALVEIYMRREALRIHCWIFLIVNCIVSASFLLIFGFWVTKTVAWLWLTSTVFASLIYILVLNNVKRIFTTLSAKTLETADTIFDKSDELILALEPHRNYLFKKFGEALLRPYLTHLYKPLSEEEIELRRSEISFRKQIAELFVDTVMFCIYIVLLYLVILAERSSLTIVCHQEMLNLISGTTTKTFTPDDIASYSDFHLYLNETLIPAAQNPQWYFKYIVKDPGMMVNFQDKYIGVIRLRQHRVANNSCIIPRMLRELAGTNVCLAEYFTKPSKDRFGDNESTNDRLANVWEYSRSRDAGSVIVVGKVATYSGGGYIAPLGRTMYNSYENLDYLTRKNWIDPATRAVFVEFLGYNPNCNLFNAVTLLVEKSATGYTNIKPYIETSKLLFVREETSQMALLVFGAFIVIVVIFVMKLLSRFWRKRTMFYKDVWLIIDVFITIMTLICLYLYLRRMALVKNFLDKIETARNNEFVNYFRMFYIQMSLTMFAAFLICISTIRLWKLLRFWTVFRIMEKTLVLSAVPILGIALCHSIFMLSFTICGYLLFGNFEHDFRDLSTSALALSLMSLGMHQDFNFDILEQQRFGYVYYSFFMIITVLIFTLYIAIIVMYYEEAQLFYSTTEDRNDLRDYIFSELIYCKTWCKSKLCRLKGGKSPVYNAVAQKSDEHRYADCICLSSNRMRMMECAVKCQLKTNYNRDRERKVQVMSEIAYCLLHDYSDEKEIFFAGKADINRIKLVHDSRIVRMEKLSQLLLNQKQENRRARLERLEQLKYKNLMGRQLRQLNYMLESLTLAETIISHIKIR